MAQLREVGMITGLNRYPVKSMRGEPVQSLTVLDRGLVDGDRQHAFIQRGTDKGFPWFTGRDNPQMTLWTPTLDAQRVVVTLPDGKTVPLDSPELKDRLVAGAARSSTLELIKLHRGAYDSSPLSLVGNETIKAVSARSGVVEDPRRFRANVEIEIHDAVEGAEDAWVGGIVRLGREESSPLVTVVRRDSRCKMVNIDPRDGVPTPAVLKDIARNRRNDMGVYANVFKAGTMYVGEPVYFAPLEI
jgi:uncharacterized protein YcbX